MNDPVISRRTKAEDLPEFLTPHQVRDFLGLSIDSVYKSIKSEELPSRRFGQRIFIPKAVFLELPVA